MTEFLLEETIVLSKSVLSKIDFKTFSELAITLLE